MSNVICYTSFAHTSIRAVLRVTCMGDSSKDHPQRKVLQSPQCNGIIGNRFDVHHGRL